MKMVRVHVLPFALLSLLSTAAASSSPVQLNELTPLPLIIWHGLGDNYASDELKQLSQLADTVNPGTYVHVVHVGDSPSSDRQATFLGNVTEQLDQVCEQIKADPILSTAPAVNALGFSQGGQFLRGYVERCNTPPVRNLVTFGSQHNGIAQFQSCQETGDWICRGAEALLRFGTWSDFVQSRLVPAQYFRSTEEMDEYLASSNFLADINNEREVKNKGYKENLASLNKFVMFLFESDDMVVPKESAHFAEVNQTSGEVTPLKDRQMYRDDWLGLKSLDEQGKLEFLTLPGQHMQVPDMTLIETFGKYFGAVEVVLGKGAPEPLVVQGEY